MNNNRVFVFLILATFGVTLVQAQNPITGFTSGIQSLLLTIGIIGIVIAILLIAGGIYLHKRTSVRERGKKLIGTLLAVLGVFILVLGLLSLIGGAILPGIVNNFINSNSLNLNNYASLINMCIAVSGYSCGTPSLSYQGNINYITLQMQQNTGINWPKAYIEFVNQTEEGTVSSTGFAYNIPFANLTSINSGEPFDATLPFANFTKHGSPIAGYVWVAYTTSNKIVTVQVATLTVT
jgi:hypothetical protein